MRDDLEFDASQSEVLELDLPAPSEARERAVSVPVPSLPGLPSVASSAPPAEGHTAEMRGSLASSRRGTAVVAVALGLAIALTFLGCLYALLVTPELTNVLDSAPMLLLLVALLPPPLCATLLFVRLFAYHFALARAARQGDVLSVEEALLFGRRFWKALGVTQLGWLAWTLALLLLPSFLSVKAQAADEFQLKTWSHAYRPGDSSYYAYSLTAPDGVKRTLSCDRTMTDGAALWTCKCLEQGNLKRTATTPRPEPKSAIQIAARVRELCDWPFWAKCEDNWLACTLMDR